MIFHIPQQRVALQSMFYPTIINYTILPIGFQPFMRCHMQYGHGMYMPNDYPLQSNIAFEKLKFRHNERLSEEIFYKMNKGELIYPHEGLTSLNEIINQICQATVFVEEAFEYAFERNTYFEDKTQCRLLLQKYKISDNNIEIGNSHPFILNDEQRAKIDEMYKGFSIEKDYGIITTTRFCIHPN